jgi:SNF2 family DNA or RNA helicase
MPKSLLLNWRNELERFCPELRYAIYYGASATSSAL